MDFLTKFATPTVAGLPKYAQLREILIAAINSGHWKPGDKLPTEAELARSSPYSLGTVQKALRALVDEGLVTRAQGSGTFVTEPRQPIDAPLHLRFLGGKGEPRFLPLFPKVLSRKRIAERGPWSDWLHQTGADIIRVDRKLSVNGEFNVFNRFYFNAATFPDIAEKPLKELDGANLKQLLGSRVNMPVTNIEQRISTCKFAPEICRAAGWKAGSSGMLLESAASARGTPLYFLESFIPPNRRKMDVSG
jgi:DNA-binding GntR family transcriptional regulator